MEAPEQMLYTTQANRTAYHTYRDTTIHGDAKQMTLIETFREFLASDRARAKRDKKELAAMRARVADQFYAMSEPVVEPSLTTKDLYNLVTGRQL
jgi:hypothetical protein